MEVSMRKTFALLIPLVLIISCNSSMDSGDSGSDFLVIDTFNPSGGGSSDIFLTLIDDVPNVLATDDDGNPDQVTHDGYARITYSTPLPAGTYYVKVHKDTTTGGAFYGIRILEYDPGSSFPTPGADPDASDSDDLTSGGIPTNPVPINIDEVKSRAINPDTDEDWFIFILP
jgi:hypothetical protein